ncbi:MAG: lipopolysaccharide biosynthesis protein [Anaerolineae bacterium]
MTDEKRADQHANGRESEQATNTLDVRQLASKVLTSSTFNISSSAITLVLGFTRSVVLARLLLPEHFGIMALAMFFMNLAARIQGFGFDSALIHRQADRDEVISTHFVLRASLGVVLVVVALIAAPFLGYAYPEQPGLGQIVIAIAVLEMIKCFNATPRVLLSKELNFKRLAFLDVMSSVAAFAVAVPLAWGGAGVWSLVGEQASGVLVRVLGLWVFKRPWKISLKIDRELVKWYFRFGAYNFLSANLNFLLDRFDDFWTGTFLGSTALGFYSKAYEFAHYPRRVIASPVTSVFFSTFAKLQHDRERLSKAFFRVSSLVIRVGFLFAGTFALITPEFIKIFLGNQWAPMAFTFQLMLLYTLFDPLLVIASNLTTAVGEPQALTKVKLLQMVFFVPAVALLGHFFGIDGVAVAADLMLILGIVIILPRVRHYVDFSALRMMGYPTLGLILALAITLLVERQLHLPNAILVLISKAMVMSIVYGIILFAFEREQVFNSLRLVASLLPRRGQALKS